MDTRWIGYNHFFVVNPKAGKKSCENEIAEVVQQFKRLGYPAWLITTLSKEDCVCQVARLTQSVMKKSSLRARFYACGGDGTLNDVLNGIMHVSDHSRIELTHIPCGSGNDFVKQFSHPENIRADNFSSDVRVEDFDVIDVGGTYCLNIASFGLDARVGTGVDKYRFLPGKTAYVASAIVNMLKPLSRHTYVSAKNILHTYDGRLTMVCACNGSWYGGGFNPVPDADPTDGWMDVLVVHKVSKLRAFSLLMAYKKGRYAEFPKVMTHFRTNEIWVETPNPEPVNIDGELATKTRTHVKLIRGGIKIFLPSNAW